MSFAPRPAFLWQLRTRSLALGHETKIMGVLNVTPDSFSDGGAHASANQALEHAHQMFEDGAHILDIGGESTRPGATPVSPQQEQDRVLPIIEVLRKSRPQALLSIDTYHASTARLAVLAGAEIVNDVSGFTWDSGMSSICAELGAGVILMHARGTPQQWRTQPALPPGEVMPLILAGLRESLAIAGKAGVAAANVVLDPGFGFGKRGEENYFLHAEFSQLHQLGRPLLSGTSRKGFLTQTLLHSETLAASFRDRPPQLASRMHATLASNTAAVLAGAHLLRVHDVRAAAEAAAVADAILVASAALPQS